jgi:hypothetical protein
MRTLFCVLSLLLIASCVSKKEFIKEEVCSIAALTYYQEAKLKRTSVPENVLVQQKMEESRAGVLTCYESYMKRTGVEEFQTCLVVGVDERAQVEYFNFSSQHINADQKFIKCAMDLIGKIPFGDYGSNYVLLQTYNFY